MQKEADLLELSKDKKNYVESFNYIQKHKKYLNETQRTLLFEHKNNLTEEKVDEIICDINLKKILVEKAEIYNLDFFESDEENEESN